MRRQHQSLSVPPIQAVCFGQYLEEDLILLEMNTEYSHTHTIPIQHAKITRLEELCDSSRLQISIQCT